MALLAFGMASVAAVVLDHMRRVVSLSRDASRSVPTALEDAMGSLATLWVLWQYEGIPLQLAAPSVRTFLYFANLQFAQLIGACASADLAFLASVPESHARSSLYDMEITYIRSELAQLPRHMITWLKQCNYVRVAEVERLVQAGIHSLDILQNIILDPIFSEMQEALAEIPYQMTVDRIRETCSQPPIAPDALMTSGATESTPSSSSTAIAGVSADPPSLAAGRVDEIALPGPAGDRAVDDEEDE